ncbi:orotidine-5'-phosphate decarboxylase [Agrococcus sp. SGAir0287]|uniref:orotidine-5'-phosphate decarboxylase n=1 Tax=Agrococcus sp. SGAir0287 TaxID=2070347 RepID=UPI0010CCFFC4|nr:orotidine-5'-phosphate decarboxylase [Agrococcus sp. SGAir0287]QCR19309.1 orotidine-5'-phosphate decarboxylase [Agrococcus sp. SGAir0287]
MTFGARLAAAVADRGPVCVGIDPHAHLLEAWGLPDTAAGAEAFGLEVVEAAADRVAVVKPQVAFFERHGSAGLVALEHVMRVARERGLLVLADAKRGDLDSTMDAYAQAWLTPGAPLEADAVTASPYLGLGSLEPALALAERHGKGVFVLCATSNPEGAGLQSRADASGESVAASIARGVDAWNAEHAPGAVGAVGLVVGATVVAADLGVTLTPSTPVLAPGFGHQGARLSELRSLYPEGTIVLASTSRAVTAARDGVAAAIDAAVEEAR